MPEPRHVVRQVEDVSSSRLVQQRVITAQLAEAHIADRRRSAGSRREASHRTKAPSTAGSRTIPQAAGHGSRTMTSSRTSRMWTKAALASGSAARWAARPGSASMRTIGSAIRWVRAMVAKSPVVSR
jgi:hypothetical protein